MEPMVNEAKEMLAEVEATGRRTRDAAAYRVAGPILALWGVVWAVCFSVTQFAPHAAGWAWLAGDGVGLAGTAWLGWVLPRHGPVLSESSKRLGRRLGGFWLALFVFAGGWLAVLWPWHGVELGVFGVTLVMFAYVVMGLWLEMRFMTVLGFVVAGLAFAGYFVSPELPGWVNLWLAVVGGGSLLASGVYLKVRWG